MQSQSHQDLYDAGLAALTSFAAREGHSCAPRRHCEDDFALGRWIESLRGRYRRGTLPTEHIDQLENFPLWQWDVVIQPPVERHERFWDEGIAALAAFSAREGHCSVPRKHREDGVGLGYWVDNKRKNYRNGILSAEQITQLEAFPSWDWGPYDDRWWPDYEIFKAHVLTGGSADPGQGSVAESLDLFAWCKQQRVRHGMGTLSPAATAALEEVPGWSWKDRGRVLDYRENALSAYRAFVLREGHGRVRRNHTEAGFPLGQYLLRARKYKRGGAGSAATHRLIDEISGDWKKSPTERESNAKRLKAQARYRRFVTREGHGQVPTRHVEWGFDLGRYLSRARHRLASGRPPAPAVQNLLDSVSTDWRQPLDFDLNSQDTTTSYPKAA